MAALDSSNFSFSREYFKKKKLMIRYSMNYLPGRESYAFHQELANYERKKHVEQAAWDF